MSEQKSCDAGISNDVILNELNSLADIAKLLTKPEKKQNQKPGDIVVLGRHYHQAFFFFNEQDSKYNVFKNRNGRVIENLIKNRLPDIIDDVWLDIVYPRVAKIFAIHEKKAYEKLSGYIMVVAKRSVIRYYSSYTARLNKNKGEIFLDSHKIARKDPSDGEANEEKKSEAPRRRDIVETFLMQQLNPVYYRVYELFYIENKSDNEIAEIIKMPIKSFSNIRERIKHTIIKNKDKLLEEIMLKCEQATTVQD